MGRREVISAVFINAAIIVIVVALLVPVARSLGNNRNSVRLYERVYAAETRLLAEYEENRRELEEMRAGRGVMYYNEMLPALAEISALGAALGLSVLEFTVSESTAQYFGNDTRFYEKRVRVVYEGELFYLLRILHELSGVRTSSFSLENDRLRIEFSLFGIGGGV